MIRLETSVEVVAAGLRGEGEIHGSIRSVSTVNQCYVSACKWDGRPNMMFLTSWLCRTLEMMQNDVRTSGFD